MIIGMLVVIVVSVIALVILVIVIIVTVIVLVIVIIICPLDGPILFFSTWRVDKVRVFQVSLACFVAVLPCGRHTRRSPHGMLCSSHVASR